MTALAVTLIVLSCVALLVWTSRHLMIRRERRTGFILTPQYAGPPEGAPKISVVLAAKDEEENIETCVRSMLSQDYPDFELIVCNDRSKDDTAEIVQHIAAEDSRVRLVNIHHLPEGWCGKNHAMHQGMAQARGQWLCLIDADCVQNSPRTLSTAMQYAADTGADLLSVLPVLVMKTFWEFVVQPVCSGVMMIWFHPDKVNSPRHRNAYANGAFMLIRRSAYDAVGGHEAIRDALNEDMHMAARIKRAGLKLRVVRNTGLYSCRMYTSLKTIIRGWARIFFGTFGTLPRLTASLLVMLIMGVLPYFTAVGGLSAARAGGGVWLAAGLLGAAAAMMQISVIFRFYGLVGAKPALAWTYPIGCGMTIISLVIALTRLRKGAKVTWRGTSYAGAAAK